VFADGASWAAAVATIWDGAQYREERYAALHLARTAPAAQPWRLDPAITLPLVRELVRAGSWWDYVDDLSSHHLCDLFVAHPVVVSAELTRWSQGDVLWLRRAAICAQLSCKGAQLDWPFLQRMILPAMSSETFWLRKAIGWSLRQAARERPDDVKLFVRTHYDQLSTLSRKEALKHLGGDKGGQPKPSSAKGRAAAAAAAPAAEMEDDEDADVDPTDAADPEAAVARSDAAEASAAVAAAAMAVPAPARGRKRTQAATK
jgi:3-methyladenine DNA glycosylase AlkD